MLTFCHRLLRPAIWLRALALFGYTNAYDERIMNVGWYSLCMSEMSWLVMYAVSWLEL